VDLLRSIGQGRFNDSDLPLWDAGKIEVEAVPVYRHIPPRSRHHHPNALDAVLGNAEDLRTAVSVDDSPEAHDAESLTGEFGG
jgi:hypothetical protein